MEQIQYPSRGKTVFGYAHIPDSKAPAPALLLCHGFTGCAAEGSRLFVHFAEEARKQGFYVLRIDFLGSGNSELNFAEYTTPCGWLDDVASGVHFLRSLLEVDETRIGLLGVSLGGFTALMAGASPDVSAVAAWAPVLNPAKTFRGILTNKNWTFLQQGGRTIHSVYSGNHFSVKSDFVQQLECADLESSLSRYGNTPALIMQGTEDAVIDPQDSLRFKERHVFSFEHEFVEGEDHSFLLQEQQNIARTLRFFKHAL